MRRRAGAALLAAITLSCGKSPTHAAVGGLGTSIASANATDLRLSPDGKWALFLSEPQRPRLEGIPPKMVVGNLLAVPVAGGEARKIARGVTNAPGGYLVSPDSRYVAALAGYNAASQEGELVLSDLSEPREPSDLSPGVTYLLFSADSKWLAYVSRGVLKVGRLSDRKFREVAGEVANAHFTPDGQLLLFKRSLVAGGSLMAQKLEGSEAPKKLADQVGDYAVSPDSRRLAYETRSEVTHGTYDLYLASLGALKPLRLATGSGGFAFSGDSKWLAHREGRRPEVGDLYVQPTSGGAARKLADDVQQFAFSPDSKAIAGLEKYDGHFGIMTVAQLPEGKPVRVGYKAERFVWGADGKSLAFRARFFKPIVSDDLMVYHLGQEKPAATKVGVWVYKYTFAPDGSYLLFGSNCTREGRACDLLKVDAAKPEAPPAKLVEGVFDWRISDDGQRILVTYARYEPDAFDVAVFDLKNSQRKTLDQFFVPPAAFAASDGSRVVYIEQNRERAGIYVANQVP